ncbi:MAG: AMP-binding protein [Acidimicrobiales bacterium]
MPKLLDAFASEHPDSTALADDHGRTSWADLHERTRRLINVFQAAELGPGDTIALLMGNRRECFEVFQACAHTGITFVPINWHWVPDEIAYVIEDSEAKALMVGARFANTASEVLADPRSESVRLALLVGGAGDTTAFDDYEEALAHAATDDLPEHEQVLGGPMFYTSGTTGRPKGVRTSLSGSSDLPAELLQLIASAMQTYVPAQGRALLVGPIYHSAQWAFTFFPMINGSSVIMRHKFDASETVSLIDEEDITNVHLVPTQFKRLLDCDEDERAQLVGASLEAVWHGAAPCPPSWKNAMIEWFGPRIHEYYGSTEGAFISTIEASDWLDRGGSVGKPLETIEVIVVDDNGRRLEQTQEGTLYFRNHMGMDFEYHNAPEKTADAHLEPGVFTTGDMGYLDNDGYLWLSDRKIDMIISGGVNIYPAEIEAVLAEHSDVADAAVIGVPNDEFGEEVKAIIEVSAGVEANDQLASELLSACRDRLAGYKQPRSVDFTAKMPRTATGKILKRELRSPYWAGSGRKI